MGVRYSSDGGGDEGDDDDEFILCLYHEIGLM